MCSDGIDWMDTTIDDIQRQVNLECVRISS